MRNRSNKERQRFNVVRSTLTYIHKQELWSFFSLSNGGITLWSFFSLSNGGITTEEKKRERECVIFVANLNLRF